MRSERILCQCSCGCTAIILFWMSADKAVKPKCTFCKNNVHINGVVKSKIAEIKASN